MEYLEILIAAVAAFLLGFLWYTALFGKVWQSETGITDEDASTGIALTHGTAFIMMLLISSTINMIINMHELHEQTLVHGAFHGAMMAAFVAIPLLVIHYMYQKKSLKLILIDGTYSLVFFSLIGAVLGALNL